MASMLQVRDGLNVLLGYVTDGDVFGNGGMIFAGGVPQEDLSERDNATLERCGWQYNNTFGFWVSAPKIG